MDPSWESNEDSEKRIRRLERLSWWMDEAFEIPVLKWRIGLDALFGLIPGVGDLVGAAVAAVVLWEASSLRVSGWVIAQMGWNVVLEYVIGIIPVFGDLFDIHFRANRRNVDLLKSGILSPRVQIRRSRTALMLLGGVLVMMGLTMTAASVWALMSLWSWLARLDIGKIVLQLRDALPDVF